MRANWLKVNPSELYSRIQGVSHEVVGAYIFLFTQAVKSGGFIQEDERTHFVAGYRDSRPWPRIRAELLQYELIAEVPNGFVVAGCEASRWGRQSPPRWLRDRVLERDGALCRACGSTEDLSLDHVIPIARGGEDDLENLQVLCRSCNSSKGAS